MPPDGSPVEALEELIADAVGKALDRRFRAMTAIAVVVALAASLAVNIPVSLFQDSATNGAAIIRARHNCRLITQIAEIMGSGSQRDRALRQGGFLSTDTFLRQQQRIDMARIAALHPGPLKQLFSDPETLRASAKSAVVDRSVTRYWARVLIPRLVSAASNDCSAR